MDSAGCTHRRKASSLMENPSSGQRKAPPVEPERGFPAPAASFAMWRLGSVGADRMVWAVPWCVGAHLHTSGLPCTPGPHEPRATRRRQFRGSPSLLVNHLYRCGSSRHVLWSSCSASITTSLVTLAVAEACDDSSRAPGMTLAGLWERRAPSAHTGEGARWQDLLCWEERWRTTCG